MAFTSLRMNLEAAGLLDEFFSKINEGLTLCEMVAWLGTQNVPASNNSVHALKKKGLYRWKAEQKRKGSKAVEFSLDERDMETLENISILLNQESTGLHSLKECIAFMSAFHDYIKTKLAMRSDERAEREASRKWASKITEILDSPEEVDRIRQINEEHRKASPEKRMTAIIEAVWGADLNRAA